MTAAQKSMRARALMSSLWAAIIGVQGGWRSPPTVPEQALVARLKSVSVIVPNYNYAHFLEARLDSIISQTYPVFEIIVLDDASTDDSRDVIERFRRKSGRLITVVANDRNSGSVFHQWRKGVAMAKGDLVWIAEADDLADPRFLERLAAEYADPALAMAFANSSQVDEHSTVLAESYDFYYAMHVAALIPGVKLPGIEFLRRFLSVRNIVFNASSVLFRKTALDQAIAASSADFALLHVAGDWHVYIAICAQGGLISYVPDPLNIHRRHTASVTLSMDYWRHLGEIIVTHGKVAKILGAENPASGQIDYIAELGEQLALHPPPGASIRDVALWRWRDALPADPEVRARATQMIASRYAAAVQGDSLSGENIPHG